MLRISPSPRSVGYLTLLVVGLVALWYGLRLWHITQIGQEFVWVRFVGSGELIGNLQEDDPVLIRGVNVGQVAVVAPDPAGAKIMLRFWTRQELRRSTIAVNMSHSLMGQRVIVLVLGDSTQPFLTKGETLKGVFSPGVAEVMSQIYRVLDLVQGIRERTQVLVQGGNGVDPAHLRILSLLAAADGALEGIDRLAQTVEKSGPVMTKTSRRVSSLSRTFPELERELGTVLRSTDSTLASTQRLLAKTIPVVANLDSNLQQIDSPTGAFAMVTRDDSILVYAQRIRQSAETIMALLEGQIAIKFNIHLLGSNPSKKGE